MTKQRGRGEGNLGGLGWLDSIMRLLHEKRISLKNQNQKNYTNLIQSKTRRPIGT